MIINNRLINSNYVTTLYDTEPGDVIEFQVEEMKGQIYLVIDDYENVISLNHGNIGERLDIDYFNLREVEVEVLKSELTVSR